MRIGDKTYKILLHQAVCICAALKQGNIRHKLRDLGWTISIDMYLGRFQWVRIKTSSVNPPTREAVDEDSLALTRLADCMENDGRSERVHERRLERCREKGRAILARLALEGKLRSPMMVEWAAERSAERHREAMYVNYLGRAVTDNDYPMHELP